MTIDGATGQLFARRVRISTFVELAKAVNTILFDVQKKV
jgi:hypothetical protein